MEFLECDPPATDAEVDAFEFKLGFHPPPGIRQLLTTANGGRPCPNVIRHGGVYTDVSECLALRSGPGSIAWTYDLMILNKHAAPTHFLPFATDSGGNLFLVDCHSSNAPVFLLTHDPIFELHPLLIGLDDFWRCLTTLEAEHSP